MRITTVRNKVKQAQISKLNRITTEIFMCCIIKPTIITLYSEIQTQNSHFLYYHIYITILTLELKLQLGVHCNIVIKELITTEFEIQIAMWV
jgi:hypothetical protein